MKPWNVRLQELNDKFGQGRPVPEPPRAAPKGISSAPVMHDTLVGRPNSRGGFEWYVVHKGYLIDAEDRRRAKAGMKFVVIRIKEEDAGRPLDWLVDTYTMEFVL
jgi:hypothetical protein